ncbi:adenylate kinase-domain-containing protein [Phakopsora pachyrhizi]|uniref:Adenylate kinase-domain-containing protein n=1 Tax=Phakopsora pachyrhizi TaxID=170000 RepID=A0AAV0B8C3_PHAPC|nr:adenylate kinase-domain-containing protein [Phakopsora pachyrhizi]
MLSQSRHSLSLYFRVSLQSTSPVGSTSFRFEVPKRWSSGSLKVDELPSQDCKNRMRMIILGAPGSGKGTHCSKLLKKFDLSMIGMGDLLRYNVSKKTEVGKLAESYISRGDLLPDEVILKLIKPEIRKLQDRDWILDGFPRTKSQAIQLDKFLSDEFKDQLNLVVSLEVPDSLIIERISGRWIHEPSGRVYNTTYNAPIEEGKDDLTGEQLTKRKDDTIEVFSRRLESFHQENKPMLNYYDSQFVNTQSEDCVKRVKKLVHIFGPSSDTIWPQMKELIRSRFPYLKPRYHKVQ